MKQKLIRFEQSARSHWAKILFTLLLAAAAAYPFYVRRHLFWALTSFALTVMIVTVLLIKCANWLKQKAKAANLAEWGMVIFTFILAATTVAYTAYAKWTWKAIVVLPSKLDSQGLGI